MSRLASRAAVKAAKKARFEAIRAHLKEVHGCRISEMGHSLSYLEAWHMVHRGACEWRQEAGS